MSQTKTNKPFDCVDFKHEAQSRLYEATRGMTPAQRSQHVRRMIETGPLAGFWEKLNAQARFAEKSGRQSP